MTHQTPDLVTAISAENNRWKDLYRIGFITCIAFPILIAVFVAAYFIWPYTPGYTSVAEIFAMLQSNRMAALVSLDVVVPIMAPVLVLQMLALNVALKKVNESWALIALVLGLMGVVLWLSARPLVEMVALSSQYAHAASDSAKIQYLAAGEALTTLFNGTSWMLSQILIAFSGVIDGFLILRSKDFSKASGYVGIIINLFGFGMLVPEVGPALGIIGTLGGIAWYLLLARPFYRLGWGGAIGQFTNSAARPFAARS